MASCETISAVQVQSKALVRVMEYVMEHFYSKRTSTVFITQQSSMQASDHMKPIEMVGEMVRTESDGIPMAYVIEDHIKVDNDTDYFFHRFFNIFIVDGYESFRQVLHSAALISCE